MKILDAEKTYMYPDVDHMKRWFDEFNRRFFENKLPPAELRVGWNGKHTLGSFSTPAGKCLITLNNWYFSPEDEWRDTMIHEMVHYYIYLKYGGKVRGHGKEFKADQ